MNKQITLFCLCGLIGLVLIVLQTIVEPATMKSATATLQNVTPESGPRIAIFAILFFITHIGYCAFSALSQILREKLNAHIVAEWTIALMRKVIFSRGDFLTQNEPEKIVSRISHDTETLTDDHIALKIELPLTLAGFLIVLYTMYFGSFDFLVRLGCDAQKGNPILATTLLCMTPLHLLFLLYNKKMMKIEQEKADAVEKEALVSTESLRAMTDVRASNAFSFVLRRITDTTIPSRNTRVRLFSITTIFQSVSGLVWGATQVTVLGIAAWLIFKVDTGFDYSDYMGFSALCAALNMSVVKIVECAINWQKARQANVRIREIESLQDVFGIGIGSVPATPSTELTFKNLSFELSKDRKILDDINLSIRPGEHVALVGPSGCGKSTLLKMAMRHLTPTTGETDFGGISIADLDFPYYSKRVAYVSQRPFIFQGSIRDNILVGRQLHLSDTELLHILDDVALTADLKRKNPDVLVALDTEIGAEGQGLSGGQMAKIALARALVGHPAVLLLDEVTAPLDELSQDRVTKMIDEKLKDKTVISISHRLPTVRNMDRIVVMESGRIVQEGTYDKLLSQPGLFATLVSRETGVPVSFNDQPKLNLSNSSRDIVQALSLSPVFSDVDSQTLQTLAPHCRTLTICQGETLFHAGDDGTELYVIKSGRVEICGHELGAGSSFGEIALFGETKRTADVKAIQDCEFLVLGRNTVLSCCQTHPEMSIKLLRTIARIAAREAAR